MKLTDIKPFVRQAAQISADDSVLEEELVSYDYCMLYMISGKAGITINDNLYYLEKGCILIWEPGVTYSFSEQTKNTTYILIHFDYINEGNVAKIYPMPPVPLQQFEKKKKMKKVEFTNESLLNDTIYLRGMHFLEDSFYNILIEYRRREKYFDFKISGIMQTVFVDVSRNARLLNKHNMKHYKIDNILSYLQTHYNEPINNEIMGEKFNFHPQYVNKLVKTRTGYTLHQYLVKTRISKAIYFLQTTDMRISEIADMVGFQDAAHFSKCFKQTMGLSPKEYREKSQTKL